MINSPCFFQPAFRGRPQFGKRPSLTNQRPEAHRGRQIAKYLQEAARRKKKKTCYQRQCEPPKTRQRYMYTTQEILYSKSKARTTRPSIHSIKTAATTNTRQLFANRAWPPRDKADWIQTICKSSGRTVVWKRWRGSSVDACEPVVSR